MQGFLLLNLMSSFVAILSIHSLRRRKEIFIVCLKAWFCCILVLLAMHLYFNTFSQYSIVVDIISDGFFMLATAVTVVGLLPLLESTFGIMTDVSLMEYMDPNNDLLRRLTIEAPGTYQHSVVVGNLAEAAALAIGANGLFCRVATLYHDVGKMATSQYFTENQIGEVNIHQLLTPPRVCPSDHGACSRRCRTGSRGRLARTNHRYHQGTSWDNPRLLFLP